VLFGEPGVGKTVLLDAAAEFASTEGVEVLRAASVEFEADMAFAGLHQVLLPLYESFLELNDVHREALDIALGFGEGPAPDRLVVSNSALKLIRRACAAQPVLVVVDNLQWLDRPSTGVLGFVAGRLMGSRVALLGASRAGDSGFFERAGLPEHELAPLDQAAAAELVAARFPLLPVRLRNRLLADAGGNPLALLELPGALKDLEPVGLAEPPIPVSRRIQGLFADRVRALPEGARALLLMTALDGTDDLRVIQAPALGRLGGHGPGGRRTCRPAPHHRRHPPDCVSSSGDPLDGRRVGHR
jgi:hypothetical protein